MAVGILLSPWTVKPGLGYGIDWANPVTNGLVEAVLFNEYGGSPYSLLRHTNLTQSGTGQTWVNQARSYDGSGGIDSLANRAEFQLTGAVSVAFGMISRVSSADTGFHDLPNKRFAAGSSGIEFGFNFRNSGVAKQMYWNNGGGYQVVAITSGATVANGSPEHWMGTRPTAATSGKLYVNGALGQSTTGLTAPAASTTGILFGAALDGSGAWTGSMLYFYLWNRELSAAEAAQVYANPYQLIAPRRTYFNTAAAATLAGARIVILGNRGIQLIGGRGF